MVRVDGLGTPKCIYVVCILLNDKNGATEKMGTSSERAVLTYDEHTTNARLFCAVPSAQLCHSSETRGRSPVVLVRLSFSARAPFSQRCELQSTIAAINRFPPCHNGKKQCVKKSPMAIPGTKKVPFRERASVSQLSEEPPPQRSHSTPVFEAPLKQDDEDDQDIEHGLELTHDDSWDNSSVASFATVSLPDQQKLIEPQLGEEQPLAQQQRSRYHDLLWLLFCFSGIMASFVGYGLILEWATSGERQLHEST